MIRRLERVEMDMAAAIHRAGVERGLGCTRRRRTAWNYRHFEKIGSQLYVLPSAQRLGLAENSTLLSGTKAACSSYLSERD